MLIELESFPPAVIELPALPVSGGIGWFAGILDLTHITPGIRLRPIQIGEAIDLCELTTR